MRRVNFLGARRSSVSPGDLCQREENPQVGSGRLAQLEQFGAVAALLGIAATLRRKEKASRDRKPIAQRRGRSPEPCVDGSALFPPLQKYRVGRYRQSTYCA